MGTVFNVHEAKTHFSNLLARVEAGKGIIIARNGEAVAKLVAVRPKSRTFGTMSFTVPGDFDAPLSDAELSSWE